MRSCWLPRGSRPMMAPRAAPRQWPPSQRGRELRPDSPARSAPMSVPRVLRPAIAALLLAACVAPAHGDPAAPAAPAAAKGPAGPEYDGKIDESATAMQLDADNFLTNIATTPDGTYAR